MEFLLGGVAAMGACVVTNPLDVVKIRMQLQGELQSKGHYTVHYRNVIHAFYTIARTDGLVALQKGLVPSLWHQLLMNGIRLGAYRFAELRGWTADENGKTTIPRSVVFGAISGILGAVAGSPLFLVKTHLQSQAAKEVAVGFQHNHVGTASALNSIYKQFGVAGLWRGVVSALPRTAVGSAAQLSSFAICLEYFKLTKVVSENARINTVAASMVSSIAVIFFFTPFDVVSTRLYNQGVDAQGKGLLYKGIPDCFIKMWRTEGFLGFYKGIGPCYFRIGPHTILCLFFWEELTTRHRKWQLTSS